MDLTEANIREYLYINVSACYKHIGQFQSNTVYFFYRRLNLTYPYLKKLIEQSMSLAYQPIVNSELLDASSPGIIRRRNLLVVILSSQPKMQKPKIL